MGGRACRCGPRLRAARPRLVRGCPQARQGAVGRRAGARRAQTGVRLAGGRARRAAVRRAAASHGPRSSAGLALGWRHFPDLAVRPPHSFLSLHLGSSRRRANRVSGPPRETMGRRPKPMRGGWVLVESSTPESRVRSALARAGEAAAAWPGAPAVRRADALASAVWGQLQAPPYGRKRLALVASSDVLLPGFVGTEVRTRGALPLRARQRRAGAAAQAAPRPRQAHARTRPRAALRPHPALLRRPDHRPTSRGAAAPALAPGPAAAAAAAPAAARSARPRRRAGRL
jgi:hypothetical protein